MQQGFLVAFVQIGQCAVFPVAHDTCVEPEAFPNQFLSSADLHMFV